MVRELNMDTQRQNFWKESIDKEATVRLAWHMRFSKEFADGSLRTTSKTRKGEISPKLISVKLPTRNERHHKAKFKPKNITTKKEKVKTDTNKDDITLPALVEMRPVSGQTRNLLYKGFSALGEGRYAYLQARKQKKPENKYEFPITSGWEYGWKITDAMKRSSTKAAEFGRTRIVKDSFYRRNGVIPQDIDLSSFQ